MKSKVQVAPYRHRRARVYLRVTAPRDVLTRSSHFCARAYDESARWSRPNIGVAIKDLVRARETAITRNYGVVGRLSRGRTQRSSFIAENYRFRRKLWSVRNNFSFELTGLRRRKKNSKKLNFQLRSNFNNLNFSSFEEFRYSSNFLTSIIPIDCAHSSNSVQFS